LNVPATPDQSLSQLQPTLTAVNSLAHMLRLQMGRVVEFLITHPVLKTET
jgi:hypothetical protein